MIISFEQSPEEYFRLSRIAFGEGALDRALFYGEKAIRGKGTTEYKLSLAEIFLSMERFSDALDLALEVLTYGRGMRAETYDILARASGELGFFYESLHYIAKKARYEEDDDTLDAMGEVMEEIVSAREKEDEKSLFLVGKENRMDEQMRLMSANFALERAEYDEAIRLASAVKEDSEQYLAARTICLRAYLRKKDNEQAARTAEEILALSPKNAYALYVLVARFKRTEYLPAIKDAEGRTGDLYLAISAAEDCGAHEVAERVAARLLERNPYTAEAYFVAAAVALNGGNRDKSEDLLKRLLSLYAKYPAQVILKGWRRLKTCEATFSDKMPAEVVRILERYVRKRSRDCESFVRSMLTDQAFRASVALILETDEPIVGRVLTYLGEQNNRQIDAFFAKILLRQGYDLVLKRAILGELLFHKNRGRIPLVQSAFPVAVSCEKPLHFAMYSPDLQEAYINIYSFVVCMTDAAGVDQVRMLAERCFSLQGGERISSEILGAAMLYRLLKEDLVPIAPEVHSEEEACAFIFSLVFGVRKLPMGRVKRFAALLED